MSKTISSSSVWDLPHYVMNPYYFLPFVHLIRPGVVDVRSTWTQGYTQYDHGLIGFLKLLQSYAFHAFFPFILFYFFLVAVNY